MTMNTDEIVANNFTDENIGYEIRYDHLYKIIIIGDSGVGKTSLLSKYIKGVFPSSPLPTIAIEFATKIIQIKEGGFIKAQIWDTAGQEKYKSITSHHYRKAVGGLIVYDITKRTTFDNVLQWLSDLKNNADKGCICALVGNKIDLVEKNHRIREVSEDEGKLLAKKYEMLFYETSALSNQSVNDAFEDLLQKIYIERRKITIIEKDKNNNVINLKTKGNIIKNNINICC
jgi:Rab family protein